MIKHIRNLLIACIVLFSTTLHASFIESTIGAAVVNDATASFFNPSALTLLKNSQVIGLGTVGFVNNEFTGQASQIGTGFTQHGSSSSHSHYYLPSLYLGIPTTKNIFVGFAIVSNILNRDLDSNSVLRYSQSNNTIQDIDFVPAIGIKFNDYFSLGGSVNFSRANILLEPTSGFPSLNIPDSQSRNNSDATGLGGDVGFLVKPSKSTLIGFNYRSAITYHFSGTSIFEGPPELISNNYSFTFWTPARSVLSISHLITPSLGVITTIQRIQWSIFKSVDLHNVATQIGSHPIIVPNASIPYHLQDSWVFTLGGQYRFNPKFILRAAATYNQSPGNGNYQISNGDSIIVGPSVGYEITKHVLIDGSYAHAFVKNEDIHITTGRNIIQGVNKGSLDAISLKLTVNI